MTLYPLSYPHKIHDLYRRSATRLQRQLCEGELQLRPNPIPVMIDCPQHGGEHRLRVDRRVLRRYIMNVNAEAHRLIEEFGLRVSQLDRQQYHAGILNLSRHYFPMLDEVFTLEMGERKRAGRVIRNEHEREKNNAIPLLLEPDEVKAADLLEFTGCFRKVRYESRDAAETGLATGVHGPEAYHVYACGYCDGYHVGHALNETAPYLYRLTRAKMVWATQHERANRFVRERGLQPHMRLPDAR